LGVILINRFEQPPCSPNKKSGFAAGFFIGTAWHPA
jgi:hypothetical protein